MSPAVLRRIVAAFAVAGVLVLSACGGSNASTGQDQATHDESPTDSMTTGDEGATDESSDDPIDIHGLETESGCTVSGVISGPGAPDGPLVFDSAAGDQFRFFEADADAGSGEQTHHDYDAGRTRYTLKAFDHTLGNDPGALETGLGVNMTIHGISVINGVETWYVEATVFTAAVSTTVDDVFTGEISGSETIATDGTGASIKTTLKAVSVTEVVEVDVEVDFSCTEPRS